MCVGERYNARKIGIGRNATMGKGGGIPETPVYEDMHAKQRYTREKKN